MTWVYVCPSCGYAIASGVALFDMRGELATCRTRIVVADAPGTRCAARLDIDQDLSDAYDAAVALGGHSAGVALLRSQPVTKHLSRRPPRVVLT